MKKFVFVPLLVVFLASCSKPETTKDGNIVSHGEGEGAVVEHKLSDGTRCAILIGANKGAISCDWKTE